MAEDRSNRTVEFAHFVAAELVRHIDRAELSTVLVAANAVAGDERARQRFGDALLTEICCELRGAAAPALPHFLFDIPKKEK